MKAKDGKKARFQRRRTLRLSAGEDARLERQAAVAGISVSEYMRRLFFGGRPVIARTDAGRSGSCGGLAACSSTILRRSGKKAARKTLRK
jgi:hypothetical protein